MGRRLLARATWSLGGAVCLLAASSAAISAPRLAASAAISVPRLTASPAGFDSFPGVPDVLLSPSQPCVEQDLIFYVRAFDATPCDSFLSAYRSGDREITIRTITHTDRRCFAAPSLFYAIRIPFGQLPAGQQTVQVRRRMLMAEGDVVVDSLVSGNELTFSVSGACPAPPPPIPAEDLPYVDQVATLPSPACPDLPVEVRFQGHFLDGCGRLASATLEGGIHLVLAPYLERNAPCPDVIGPWIATVSIGNVQPGQHSVLVKETVLGNDAVWPPSSDFESLGLFDFTVGQTACRPDSTPLPYVSSIAIDPVNDVRICPDTPYRVSIAGWFPNNCWYLRKVLLLSNAPTPVVRLLLDKNCVRRLCPPDSVPWDTSLVLPGLPPGTYAQQVQVGLVTCSDSIPPDSLFSTRVPFAVASPESCGIGPPVGCLLPSWTPGDGRCNAFVGSDGKASLGFAVATRVPLAGLQGEFRLLQGGLQIVSIVPVGPAAQMRLAWSATLNGARFVLFAEHGAPIPDSNQPVEVVRVNFEVNPVPARPPVSANGFDVLAEKILGSDLAGQAVPECPVLRPAPVVAHICWELQCDFDGNGVADVRDLVQMVHCVNGDGPCPADSVTRFDCNGDSLFDLADVICCAMHLLRGPDCPQCPVDSTRDEPAVRAAFQDPIVTPSGVDIPLRLWGTDRLGAARLALRFPSDRFTFAGAEAHDGSWLELHEGGSGDAAIGLIRLRPDITVAPGSGQMQVLLHLALRPGASVGGQISLATGEFSGMDGKMLRVDLGATPRSLDGKPTLTISSIRPNPSTSNFQIDLVLDAPARVEVSVLDLAGRRVAQLFQGDLAAGSRRFVWDGNPGRGGVYFLRASVGGQVVTRKLVLLGQMGGYRLMDH